LEKAAKWEMNMNKTGMGNRTETGNIHSLYFSPFFFWTALSI